jgi:hypothetical protein
MFPVFERPIFGCPLFCNNFRTWFEDLADVTDVEANEDEDEGDDDVR